MYLFILRVFNSVLYACTLTYTYTCTRKDSHTQTQGEIYHCKAFTGVLFSVFNSTMYCMSFIIKQEAEKKLSCSTDYSASIAEKLELCVNVQRSIDCIDNSRGSIPLQLVCRHSTVCILTYCVHTLL